MSAKGRWPVILLLTLMAAGVACGYPLISTPSPTPLPEPPAPSPTPTRTPEPVIVTPSATPSPLPPDSGWHAIAAGLENRSLRVTRAKGELVETITLLRIEPALFRFQVAYSPDAPRSVQQWAADTGAAITVNAGFFTPEYTATGLLIADGVSHGASFGDFAGMFAVRPDGVSVRWLRAEPHDPAEPLVAAVQSFPVLVRPGGALGYPEEDGMPSRRTVIAQDRAGRILLIICPNGAFTLHQLAEYLLESDLELDVALNLDGGTSTGLSLSLGGRRLEIPGFVPIPAVILINPVQAGDVP